MVTMTTQKKEHMRNEEISQPSVTSVHVQSSPGH